MARDRWPSEYGGEPGRIAASPHPFGDGLGKTSEYGRMIRATNPADAADTPEAALLREFEEEGRG